jgi:hypothetical protein
MRKIILATALVGFGSISAPAFAQDATAGTHVFTDPGGFEAEETPGGYEPARPPLPADLAPGTRVKFVPQQLTPTQAYPPPAPLESYPSCADARQDNCLQGRDTQYQPRGRRHHRGRR